MKNLAKISDEDFIAIRDTAGARIRRIRKEMNVVGSVSTDHLDSIVNDILMSAQGIDYGYEGEEVSMNDRKLGSKELATLNIVLHNHYGDIISIIERYLKDNDKDEFFTALEDFYNSDLDKLEL